MALKKPSDFFKKDIATVSNSVKELPKTPELNKFSDVFESSNEYSEDFEILSEFSETLDNYKLNVEKVNYLSEKIKDIQSEIRNLLTKEDFDHSMMSQLLVVEKSIRNVQNKVKGINQKNLTEIKANVSELTESVSEFLQVDVPKYKKLIVDSELRTDKKFTKLEETVNKTLEDVGEFVDDKYQQLTETLQGINEQSLDGILEDFKILDENFAKLRKEEIPKYKGFIVETERKTESKLNDFKQVLEETTNSLLEKISEVEGDKTDLIKVVNDKIQEVTNLGDLISNDLQESEETRQDLKKKVTNLEANIIRNESHIRTQNKSLEQIQEDVKSTIQKLNIDELERQNHKLGKKIKYLEEVFEKFSEKEILTENIIAEPPSTKNKDPLTPLDQNFVTLDQFQQHYRLFINRIQQQLSTLGGGGETRLKYLDDIVGIATNASAYDDKFLKYNHSVRKFEFVDVVQDTDDIITNSVSIRDTDSNNNFSGDIVSVQKSHIAMTQTTDPTSIHKFIPVETYGTVEFFIQAIRDVNNIDSRKILVVNDLTNINNSETQKVSIGSSFVDYDITIEDGYVNLIADPTTSLRVTYSISYTAITRPTILNIIATEDDNAILTENDKTIITEDY